MAAIRTWTLGAGLPGGPGGSAATAVTGPDVLKGLSSADASEVQQIAQYERMLPARYMNTPRGEKILDLVNRYTNGAFSQSNYDKIRAAKVKFTSGTQGDTIRKLNTTLGHLSTFAEKALALDNKEIQLWNAAANAGKAATGNPKVDGLKTAVEPVAADLVQLLRGSGGAEADIKAWRERLTAAKSPAQYAEVLGTMAEVIRTQQEGLTHQWETATDGAIPLDLLSKGAEEALAKTDLVIRKLKGATASRTGLVNPF